MKLSVIILAFRTEETLTRCVESVTSQSYKDMEIVLIDDGSPDQCGTLCDQLAANDDRIKVIHKTNGGVSDARNRGLEVATGNYITFVDSDDELTPGTYKPLMQLISNHPEYDLVEYAFDWKYFTHKEKHVCFGEHTYRDMSEYWHTTQAYNHAFPWNKIYKRELFKGITYPLNTVFEDVWVFPALLANTKVLHTTDLGSYRYYDNPRGITNNVKKAELEMHLKAHLHAFQSFNDPRYDCSPYYMEIVNRQIDLYNHGGEILLQNPTDAIKVSSLDSLSSKIKAIIVNLMGIKELCKIEKFFYGSQVLNDHKGNE